MRNIAPEYRAIQLINPGLLLAGTSTGGTFALTPNDESDSMAIVSIGAVLGSPTGQTVAVTISASATQDGSYTTIRTFPVATQANQIGTSGIKINTGLYAWVKASALVGFTGGTNPSINVGVTLLQQQTIASDTNKSVLI